MVDILPRAEVSRVLHESEWRCELVKQFGATALWRTAFGFYFSVPNECTEEDLDDIWRDYLVMNGKKRNV